MTVRRFSAEEKRTIVTAYLSGARMAEVCREHQVSGPTVYQWRDRFLEGGSKALAGDTPSKREALLEIFTFILKWNPILLFIETEITFYLNCPSPSQKLLLDVKKRSQPLSMKLAKSQSPLGLKMAKNYGSLEKDFPTFMAKVKGTF